MDEEKTVVTDEPTSKIELAIQAGVLLLSAAAYIAHRLKQS